jgi:transcriptional regulator with XRE-family HTH domain/tetratricopeptide (TPR) repeat protein
MNVLPADKPIDPCLWERPQMRMALAQHNISEVYRLLSASGVSQRRIAALTGQHQSEVSAISQGRQVQAYDVLARIADGLGIPRGYLGLAYTDLATQRLASPTDAMIPEDNHMERRTFLGLTSKIVMGAALTPAELDLITVTPRHTPIPHHIGATEINQLRMLTSALRTYDAAHGGGSCRDAILAHTHWAESLLTASCPDTMQQQLLSAVAEAKILAGWTAHDLGLAKQARQYLTQALLTTQQANNPAHSAIVLYHLGRVPLDNGEPTEALKLFQLGQITAQDSRSNASIALLLAAEALAHAHLDDSHQATNALRRAEDDYTNATGDDWPEFLQFFDLGALETNAARVHSRLSLTHPKHRNEAIARLNQALADGPTNRARQRAFNLTWLATCTLAVGDFTSGATLGNQALEAVRTVRSTRLLRNLKPLHAQAQQHTHHSDIQQLANELQLLRTSS